MGEAKKEEVDFILPPATTPHEVVSLLLDRFPAMQDVICPDEDCFEEPTRAYDSFAAEVVRRVDDRQFIDSVGHFVNDAARRNDPLLREALIACLLEGIAVDPEAARRLSDVLSEDARRLLRDVERNFYHRMNM
jgi:hypothetical protein